MPKSYGRTGVKFLTITSMICVMCAAPVSGAKEPGRRISRVLSIPPVDEPKPVGRGRSPSPPRHAPTPIVHVMNLVRPYTLPQLKELLGHTGTLVPDGFWIDSVKSHCFVIVRELEMNDINGI